MLRKSWHNKDEVGIYSDIRQIKSIDSLCDEALEQVDPQRTLSDNITYLKQHKYFHKTEAEIQKKKSKGS